MYWMVHGIMFFNMMCLHIPHSQYWNQVDLNSSGKNNSLDRQLRGGGGMNNYMYMYMHYYFFIFFSFSFNVWLFLRYVYMHQSKRHPKFLYMMLHIKCTTNQVRTEK